MAQQRHSASFRDPSGYVFVEDGEIKRAVFPPYFTTYEALNESGFYQRLFDKNYLIPHTELSKDSEKIVLKPEPIPFITYPYEWSFTQYKHAALLTLKIQQFCLENNFSLKDATAFNISFHNGNPIFIDSLSFDVYKQGEPWHAYRQFVMHFLGPLILSHYYGPDFLQTLKSEIDGISLEKLVKLLPWKARLNPVLFANIYLPAKYEKRYQGQAEARQAKSLGKGSLLKLIASLYAYVEGLSLKSSTEWDHYYQQLNYSDAAFKQKEEWVAAWFEYIQGTSAIDIGSNDGTFSRVLLKKGGLVLSADIDANAVDANYRLQRKQKGKGMIPLVADFLNPAPGIGFLNTERTSLLQRISDLKLSGCMALAVIHHLSLSGNVPFEDTAKMFADMAPQLLIEFPTREDSWVQFLLKSKREFQSHFDFYNQTNFEKAYSVYFEIVKKQPIAGSSRILYQMSRKN